MEKVNSIKLSEFSDVASLPIYFASDRANGHISHLCFRKQMKPFTIRKAAQPSRAGAHTGLAAADTSVDVSMNKYNTTGGAMDRGNSVNYGPLSTAKDDAPPQVDPEDETLLEQADLDKLAEDFPGKTPENPWIKEQTNKQYLTAIKVSKQARITFFGGPYATRFNFLTSSLYEVRVVVAVLTSPARQFQSQRNIIIDLVKCEI